MIPSTAPPFAMTRWVAQTRQNYVSVTPYNYTDGAIHGFQGTHQPAIWMGESGQVVVVPGAGEIRSAFEQRGMPFRHDDEVATASYYRVAMDALEGGRIAAEMSASTYFYLLPPRSPNSFLTPLRSVQSAASRVGHLRFSFIDTHAPYILVEATRPSVMGSADPTNLTYPSGSVSIDAAARTITGRNPERQDFIIGPNPAPGWAGFFCARFDAPPASVGLAQNATLAENATRGDGALLAAYYRFAEGTTEVGVRVGVSFISEEQACSNVEREVPEGTSLEETARKTRAAWAEKLDRIQVEGADDDERKVFYTAVYHTLQVSQLRGVVAVYTG